MVTSPRTLPSEMNISGRCPWADRLPDLVALSVGSIDESLFSHIVRSHTVLTGFNAHTHIGPIPNLQPDALFTINVACWRWKFSNTIIGSERSERVGGKGVRYRPMLACARPPCAYSFHQPASPSSSSPASLTQSASKLQSKKLSALRFIFSIILINEGPWQLGTLRKGINLREYRQRDDTLQ